MNTENAFKAPHQDVVVSIVCITYNQEAYIAQALDSFVMQNTTFPIEIIVHDDASTDKTPSIIRSYEEKYPNLFVCIYQMENQYSKGVHIWSETTFPIAQGKYIALCEGDDYWTDPLKLQKQVDLMESLVDCSLSFHNAMINYDDKSEQDKVFCHDFVDNQVFTIKDLILRDWYSPTASIVFKRCKLPAYPDWALKGYNWDLALQFLLYTAGYAIYIDEVMSVYRKNAVNSLSSRNKRASFHIHNLIRLLTNVNSYTRYKYTHLILFRTLWLRTSPLRVFLCKFRNMMKSVFY